MSGWNSAKTRDFSCPRSNYYTVLLLFIRERESIFGLNRKLCPFAKLFLQGPFRCDFKLYKQLNLTDNLTCVSFLYSFVMYGMLHGWDQPHHYKRLSVMTRGDRDWDRERAEGRAEGLCFRPTCAEWWADHLHTRSGPFCEFAGSRPAWARKHTLLHDDITWQMRMKIRSVRENEPETCGFGYVSRLLAGSV